MIFEFADSRILSNAARRSTAGKRTRVETPASGQLLGRMVEANRSIACRERLPQTLAIRGELERDAQRFQHLPVRNHLGRGIVRAG